MSANSSSTRAAPTPNTDAATAYAVCEPPDRISPATPPPSMSTTPNTTWWMCISPTLTSRNQPILALIRRTLMRGDEGHDERDEETEQRKPSRRDDALMKPLLQHRANDSMSP